VLHPNSSYGNGWSQNTSVYWNGWSQKTSVYWNGGTSPTHLSVSKTKIRDYAMHLRRLTNILRLNVLHNTRSETFYMCVFSTALDRVASQIMAIMTPC